MHYARRPRYIYISVSAWSWVGACAVVFGSRRWVALRDGSRKWPVIAVCCRIYYTVEIVIFRHFVLDVFFELKKFI